MKSVRERSNVQYLILLTEKKMKTTLNITALALIISTISAQDVGKSTCKYILGTISSSYSRNTNKKLLHHV